MIRLAAPDIGDAEIEAAAEALRSGMLVQGPRVAAFEGALAAALDGGGVAAVSSGTAALHVALLALGLERGDVVVVPTFSWPATANVVEIAGGRTVFADIDEASFAIDPEALAAVLRRLRWEGARVRAVIAVHPFGVVADMPAIAAIAGDVAVIEDAACAVGSRLGNRAAGRFGTIGCFSFHPRKVVTTGEGGAVVTDDAALLRRMRALRNHGLDPDSPTADFILPGLNYRMTEFQAVLGTGQLARLDRILAFRRAAAERYDALLRGSGLRPQQAPPNSIANIQSYVGLLPEDDAANRDRIIAGLRAAGIEATIGTWHIPLTRYYRERYGHRPGDFPSSDKVFAAALTLPLAPSLTAAEQERVADRLLALLGRHRR